MAELIAFHSILCKQIVNCVGAFRLDFPTCIYNSITEIEARFEPTIVNFRKHQPLLKLPKKPFHIYIEKVELASSSFYMEFKRGNISMATATNIYWHQQSYLQIDNDKIQATFFHKPSKTGCLKLSNSQKLFSI